MLPLNTRSVYHETESFTETDRGYT
jgi:hypothetical protein